VVCLSELPIIAVTLNTDQILVSIIIIYSTLFLWLLLYFSIGVMSAFPSQHRMSPLETFLELLTAKGWFLCVFHNCFIYFTTHYLSYLYFKYLNSALFFILKKFMFTITFYYCSIFSIHFTLFSIMLIVIVCIHCSFYIKYIFVVDMTLL